MDSAGEPRKCGLGDGLEWTGMLLRGSLPLGSSDAGANFATLVLVSATLGSLISISARAYSWSSGRSLGPLALGLDDLVPQCLRKE